MEKISKRSQDNIFIHVPVRIGHRVLENFIQKKFTGEKIKDENEEGEGTTYAEILNVSLEKSKEEDFDLAIFLEIKTLTSFFRNKTTSLILHTSLEFDEKQQEIKITDYKLKGTGKNWFVNKTLQTVANRFMYNKLKSKMNVAFGPQMKMQQEKLNQKLLDRLEASSGIFISGRLNRLKIAEVISGHSYFLVYVDIEGSTAVDVEELNF